MPRPRADHRMVNVRLRRAISAIALIAAIAVLLTNTLKAGTKSHPRRAVATSQIRQPDAHPTPTSVTHRTGHTSTTPPITAPTTVSATRTTTALTPALAAVAGTIIAIDPGHNGKNYLYPNIIDQPVNIGTQTRACDTTGTETQDGYTESAYNLDVALRLAAILHAAGATVVLTRTNNDGWGPCINQRAAIGNHAHAAVAISIHADGGPPDGHGFHVLYPPSIPGLTAPIAAASLRLAYDIRYSYHLDTDMSYATYIGNGDGLMARTDLGGLNLSTVPKVFIETGNMRNQADAALLESPTFRQQAATAIADGLARYLADK